MAPLISSLLITRTIEANNRPQANLFVDWHPLTEGNYPVDGIPTGNLLGYAIPERLHRDTVNNLVKARFELNVGFKRNSTKKRTIINYYSQMAYFNRNTNMNREIYEEEPRSMEDQRRKAPSRRGRGRSSNRDQRRMHEHLQSKADDWYESVNVEKDYNARQKKKPSGTQKQRGPPPPLKIKPEDAQKFRISTMVSRNRGCVIITGVAHLMKLLCLPMRDYMRYIMDSEIEREIIASVRSGEEIDNPESYAVYLTEMGISRRSPYSATMCPGLHLWIHTVRCMLGSARSCNARYIETGHYINIIKGACLAALMFERQHKPKQRIVKDAKERRELIEKEQRQEETEKQELEMAIREGIPLPGDVGVLGNYSVEALQGVLTMTQWPKELGEQIRSRLGFCGTARINSIGQRVYALFFPNVQQQKILGPP